MSRSVFCSGPCREHSELVSLGKNSLQKWSLWTHSHCPGLGGVRVPEPLNVQVLFSGSVFLPPLTLPPCPHQRLGPRKGQGLSWRKYGLMLAYVFSFILINPSYEAIYYVIPHVSLKKKRENKNPISGKYLLARTYFIKVRRNIVWWKGLWIQH